MNEKRFKNSKNQLKTVDKWEKCKIHIAYLNSSISKSRIELKKL